MVSSFLLGRRFPAALLFLLSAGATASARAATAAVPTWTDLVTPLQTASPRMRFHEGQVDPKTNQPLVLPALPAIPGVASDWYVAQWNQSSYLDAAMARASPGGAGWSFTVPDGHLSVQINRFDDPIGTGYHLYESGGTLQAGGGSNLFLTAPTRATTLTYADPVEMRVGTRIEDAYVRYDTPTAQATGAVLAMAFVGTGALYLPPAGAKEAAQFVFVQIPVTVSRAVPAGPGIICSLAGTAPMLLYTPAMTGLAFRADGRIQTQVVEMQDVIRQMLSKPYPCGGRTMTWSANQTNLANWSFTGLYAGLETENRDARGAGTAAAQGVAELGLEFTELSVKRRSTP